MPQAPLPHDCIVWLQTTGDASDNEIAMDDLGYAYGNGIGNSNQLRNVTDFVTVGMSQRFYDGNIAPGVDDYEYDENGNMTVDRNKGITSITYNHLNLPTQIYWAADKKIDYLYNAAGQKVQKTVTQYLTNSMEVKEVDYLDGYQYAGGVLQFFPHGEGYISATPNSIDINGVSSYFYNYVFNYTDHLGNVRISYTRDPGSNQLKILEENHYYPFGLKHSIYSTGHKRDYVSREDENSGASLPPVVDYVTSTRYQYKYNGKELQDELGLGMYDYGWRQYDPAIARWVVSDPLANRFADHSNYAFVGNNPLINTEIDGMWWWSKRDEKQAEGLRKDYNKNLDKLNKNLTNLNTKLENATSDKERTSIQSEIHRTNDKIIGNQDAIANLDAMANDEGHGYSFNLVSGESAQLEFGGIVNHETKGDSKKIIINYLSDSNLTHENSHGADVARGLLVPSEKGYSFLYSPSRQSLLDGEIKAYQTQLRVHGDLNGNVRTDKPLPTHGHFINGDYIKSMYYIDTKGDKQYIYKDLK